MVATVEMPIAHGGCRAKMAVSFTEEWPMPCGL